MCLDKRIVFNKNKHIANTVYIRLGIQNNFPVGIALLWVHLLKRWYPIKVCIHLSFAKRMDFVDEKQRVCSIVEYMAVWLKQYVICCPLTRYGRMGICTR